LDTLGAILEKPEIIWVQYVWIVLDLLASKNLNQIKMIKGSHGLKTCPN
jgi:hypothetical protein